MVKTIYINVNGQGLHPVTRQVDAVVQSSGQREGLCSLFIRHTSASLLIQENDPHYTHTLEGADDMPAHIKSALTATSLSIPIQNGVLMLGTWQGIYLWEHRYASSRRELVIHIGS